MSGINKTVEIYGQKITYGSLIVAVLGLVIGTLLLFNGLYYSGAIALVMYAGASYTINCVVLGECNKWAAMLVLINILAAVSTISAAYTAGKKISK